MTVGVFMDDRRQGPGRPGADVQLFANLPGEALLQGLTGLLLAAGKLPISAKCIVIFALANQKLFVHG